MTVLFTVQPGAMVVIRLQELCLQCYCSLVRRQCELRASMQTCNMGTKALHISHSRDLLSFKHRSIFLTYLHD